MRMPRRAACPGNEGDGTARMSGHGEAVTKPPETPDGIADSSQAAPAATATQRSNRGVAVGQADEPALAVSRRDHADDAGIGAFA
jgi:hypothetical protein